ncbi:60S ribosomal subunit assembly/export protein [Orbilia oligospora]|uniref:60S ribosomal subunit assembly/export protein n=2 Tax=Orbilia oligospora TaxID=2813651 RepID=A0A6G1MJ09_ORBOL|nr:60S ribosomal subunit assembly/export protein [Orbilia oligospora]KAF3257743.1 60S ribosomal subunit assembly/export protein [Orbilia oligospora]
MAPVKRPRASSASKNSLSSSSKRRKTSSSSSSTTDPKPFTPGTLSSSKRHKKPTPSSSSSSTTTTTKTKTKIRKPHKKPLKDRYTDAQLKLPTLNGIVPAGVTKPRGKKKGKVFVEDKETMMDILELVNNSVDGVIQGKVEKNRRLEVVREQKRKEQERREREKEAKLEDVKDSLKKKRKRRIGGTTNDDDDDNNVDHKPTRSTGKRKSVSFA